MPALICRPAELPRDRRQAEKWVPNLKAVFQCIYYGAFPIAILLMLSPMGFVVLRIIFSGWSGSKAGAVICHHELYHDCSGKERMRAVVAVDNPSGGDIPLFAQAGIQAVEADISVMAGYLSMSIPFWQSRWSQGQAGLRIWPPQPWLSHKRRLPIPPAESATGNLSIGNTGYDNHSFHQTAGFSHDTNPAYMTSSGYSTARHFRGGRGTGSRWPVGGQPQRRLVQPAR